MDVAEKPAEISPDESVANLVDASIEQQESSLVTEDKEDKKHSTNGQVDVLETDNDKTLTLPSDIPMKESQEMPEKADDEVAAANGAKEIIGSLDENQENKNEGITSDQNRNQSEISKKLHHEEVVTPKAEEVVTPKAEEVATAKAEAESTRNSNNWLIDPKVFQMGIADASGTVEEQAAFMKELERFHKDRALEFKPPKFYGEPLNCLKLWRAVIKLGGYDVVTGSKLWRIVGESFHPPKTCTTISWTFRIFYEKALLEYERHKTQTGALQLPVAPILQPTSIEKEANQAAGSNRARRNAASRAMKGWQSHRYLEHGEDKNFASTAKRERNLKSIGLPRDKSATNVEHGERAVHHEADKQIMTSVVDVGPPADWVKISVREAKDCFEVYALVPGLLREEVRVQSDPAGRLVITGQPEQLENPWGITPFKKVVSLPSRIDPLQTSAVVSLHGRLFVRVPFEQGSALT
ncbi:AT-rich interactive domain-containing protein 5 isoform X2 [Rhodamnia argentea]|uniref:AT-rich interactive domain-containing protein 5 isoform X2 n=1 Tax=Rhodamnia argentea TaxID=178133 RepID=A0ABM3H442_9MYRT|nr:AT-rich interactive domain-containing protein 5 isoform X2 [Rhodamnia argentea]